MDELEAHEAKVVEAVAGPWEKSTIAFRKALLARWSANGGTISAAEVRVLARRLDTRSKAAPAATLLGKAAEIGDARVQAKTEIVADAGAAKIVAEAATKPGPAKAEMLRRAGALDLSTMSGLLSLVGPLGRSVGEMKGAAQYATHATANAATIAAAEEAGDELVFVPERDACVRHCNPRAGDVGEAATSDPPPLHPWCRCRLEPFTDPGVPRALKREAVRSTLRGFSLPSESEAERLRAAAELLRRQPAAPESVKAYARRAVREGKFPRGRSLPSSGSKVAQATEKSTPLES